MRYAKYHEGQRVRIADDLGPYMTHFTASADATIIHSDTYLSINDRNGDPRYVIDIDGEGYSAWYEESQLTPIKGGYYDT